MIFCVVVYIVGLPQCFRPLPRFSGHVAVSCCREVSKSTINVPVNECFEQRKKRFSCRVHAFIFTNGTTSWCVDPEARWLQQRLQKLEKRGICCQIL
uniref:Chemokine interleukin-8-like domain-containing protein n=1 Tax=Stegastes partitus TaxID=144197 RepID=A0A3B4Z2F3_9TELE